MGRASERRLLSWLGAVLLVISATPAVLAAAPSGAAAVEGVPVTFEVTVVHARKADGGVDPALRDLAGYLEKSFPGYQSFRQLARHETTVKVGEEADIALPDRQMLSLRYLDLEGGFVKVRLELNGLKTTVKVRAGGLFFQAGRRYRDGMLVLGIRART